MSPNQNQNSEDGSLVTTHGKSMQVNLLRVILLLFILLTSIIGITGKYIYADLNKRCDENKTSADLAEKSASAALIHSAVVDEKILTIQRTIDKIDVNVSELLRRMPR